MHKYPVVLIHGLYGFGDEDKLNTENILPYWGPSGGNVVEHLKEQGREVYYPSLGPFNSAWDRACIFWAYLFGGRVDYGKVHSEKYGHERYGATYPGVLKDLGKTEEHKKIELFGHSFGGPTVKEISSLFTKGDKEERESGDHSPLFDGGHGDLLHTVTTLSGVNNGTTAATLTARSGLSLYTIFLVMMADMINEGTVLHDYYNFKLDQWEGTPFHKFISYARNDEDNIASEMTVKTVQEDVNPKQVINPNTYYFARTAVETSGLFQWSSVQSPDCMCPACSASGMLLGHYLPFDVEQYDSKMKDWFQNDGYVNYVGQKAPLNQKSEPGWLCMRNIFQPGVWYNIDPVHADHLFWCGWSGDKRQLFHEFDTMLDVYDNLK